MAMAHMPMLSNQHPTKVQSKARAPRVPGTSLSCVGVCVSPSPSAGELKANRDSVFVRRQRSARCYHVSALFTPAPHENVMRMSNSRKGAALGITDERFAQYTSPYRRASGELGPESATCTVPSSDAQIGTATSPVTDCSGTIRPLQRQRVNFHVSPFLASSRASRNRSSLGRPGSTRPTDQPTTPHRMWNVRGNRMGRPASRPRGFHTHAHCNTPRTASPGLLAIGQVKLTRRPIPASSVVPQPVLEPRARPFSSQPAQHTSKECTT
ncbi:hypothetical protein BC827DRAFT_10873 [Russula dissimulans]|nr:hypothetical protein BC827DRAFT_10873 [Russula dissimulans]